MGKRKVKSQKKHFDALSATELLAGPVPPEARRRGRRLVLRFMGAGHPELDRIEFHGNQSKRHEFRQRGELFEKKNSFKSSPVSRVLSMFFLDHLCARLKSPPKSHQLEGGDGSPAATLGYALAKSNGRWFALFTEYPETGGKINRVCALFGGANFDGHGAGQRFIFVRSDELPPDCFEVYWRDELLTGLPQIQKLTDRFRKAWELPPPIELDLPAGEGGAEKPPEKPSPPSAEKPKAAHKRRKPRPKTEPAVQPPEYLPKIDLTGGAYAFEFKAQTEPLPARVPECEPPLPGIDPQLFKVTPTGAVWPDETPLIELGQDATHTWTLKNAFEGVLILGRTGSGKTTGSGFTLAEAFLRAGFGGLILTVKRNEAEHWRRLCAGCGRENDFVVVQRGGNWKLNILAYEAQRPGQGAGLSENLTSFCRNLLNVSSRSQEHESGGKFWEKAGDQLLNATFDLFLLAGGGITFDRLADFVAAAPTDDIPQTEARWLEIPDFGSVLLRAKQSLSSPEDERLFGRATDYWFKVYPGLASRTRTSVTLGIYAMFDAFRGRDIPALISSDTNLTPESIMSGKIVVIDLPLKELQHTGLMVQSSWKYLFQTALERQDNPNSPQRRPVFLWEDEAQYFFSDHDHQFQDTARSSRVCRVILTQNLPSFYREFGRQGVEITNSIFGNLNTKIFHNNSDPQTNEWAAKHFGTELHTRYTVSHSPAPPARDMWDLVRRQFDPPNTTGISSAEHWEYAVRPEEFNVLRTGGPENDFMVDAYITWMGLSTDQNRHFTKITFSQNIQH